MSSGFPERSLYAPVVATAESSLFFAYDAGRSLEMNSSTLPILVVLDAEVESALFATVSVAVSLASVEASADAEANAEPSTEPLRTIAPVESSVMVNITFPSVPTLEIPFCLSLISFALPLAKSRAENDDTLTAFEASAPFSIALISTSSFSTLPWSAVFADAPVAMDETAELAYARFWLSVSPGPLWAVSLILCTPSKMPSL